MYPESRLRRTAAPTLEELFAAQLARTDEFAPFVGTLPPGSFAGDAAAPVNRPLPAARPPVSVTPAAPVSGPLAQPTMTEAYPGEHGVPPIKPTPPFMGERTTGLSPLGKLLAQHRALRTAPVSSKVVDQAEGFEILPPEKLSRGKQTLVGLLQGANIAAQTHKGDPWATLGGAATGAVTGGVSPAMVAALTRQQEIDRVGGQAEQQAGLDLAAARIGGVEAQAEYDRVRPLIEAARIQQQQDTSNARIGATREATAARSAAAAEANRARIAANAERERHNRAVEGKPTGTNERTVNGAIYRKDNEGVWRIAPGSPAPAPRRDIPGEKATDRQREATEKGRQAEALYRKGSEYWDQAKAKRAEAAQLGSSVVGRTTNKDTITRLTREAEGLEAKTREVQLKGDLLAAESEGVEKGGGPGGRTLEGAVEAFKRSQKRDPTPEELERMRAALER